MSEVWTREIDWDNIEARFRVPDELDQPSPRHAVLRDKQDMGCRARIERGCLGGCLIYMLVLGLLLLFWGGLAALILPMGATATGIVTERERGSGRDSTYFLRFRFQVEDRSYKGQGQVPTAKWRESQIGDKVRVRYFPFAPGLRPLLADDFSPWASIFGFGILGILLTSLGALPLLAILSERQGKRLVLYGFVTPAVIIGVRKADKKITLLVRDQNGRTIEVEHRLKREGIYALGVNEVALYPAGKPERARLYDDLGWKAVRR